MRSRLDSGLCVMCSRKLTHKNKSALKGICMVCSKKIEKKAAKILGSS